MSGEEQFRILHQHWHNSEGETRGILVSTYAKLVNLYKECRPLVAPAFTRCKNSIDVEIQHMSAEYSAMREAFRPETVEDLLREMPPFEVATVQEPPTPHLGNCLDLRGNPYYKKLKIGDIVYNPYQKLVAKVIKWKSRLCEVQVYA